ncbi:MULTISPECIES: hypothetical protein [unclassified Rhizobium]|uniref:hypothetical protein n=1 Tax=unclassified Rhizobium TaxID=2613769 RepID=UPI00161B2536|nr:MULTISPECIES: hypothetical protein [unclassified Rhizobium]MBB3544425.1 hypothetical protein [Rhizobium sp. BK399]MCS3742589.1 hypothetical protein [Rhizobium sp. BK661]MCS4094555.1 hypothetical protein [Rhizobium sp. BK176]
MVGISPFARISLAFVFAALLPLSGQAQEAFQTFKQLDTTAKMPKLNAFIAPGTAPQGSKLREVALEAKLTANGDAVQDGLSWYVFSPMAGSDGKLPLIASSQGGSADFQLAPGDYFVNVSFGRAGVTRKLTVPEDGTVGKQTMVLEAGGLLLNAVSGSDVRIRPDQLSFSIYSAEVREDGERGLVMADVPPNTVVRLNAGTYHIISEYGETNASIRADIQVEAGKLTEATIQHKAAQITFKLVSEAGGEAIADTAWSILTAAGDSVGESVSAFPTMVLAEGEYSAVARNKDKIYQRDFKVEAGKNTDVEVLMKDVQPEAPTAAAKTVQLQADPQPGQASSGPQPLPSYDQLQGATGGADAD